MFASRLDAAHGAEAVVFDGAGRPLRVERFALPRLGPGEALVEIDCCTLCGSDVHTYLGHRQTPCPTVLGHEMLGRLAATGEGGVVDVAGRPVATGQRVTWSIAASCGACFFCQRGLPQKCERLFKYGHERLSDAHALSGGLAQACRLAAGTAIVRVPDSLPDRVACPANCATSTVAAALRYAGNLAGQSVLLQGAGMLGLTAAAMAADAGAAQIILCDANAERLRAATSFGATHAVLVGGDTALADLVRDLTHGRGVDAAIELCGAPAAVEQGLDLLRIGGRYVLVGAVFPARPVQLAAEQVVRRLLTVQGLHNYASRDLAAAIDFLERCHERYPFADLVAGNYALDDAESAFQAAASAAAYRIAVTPQRG